MIQHRAKHIPCSSKRMSLTVQCILVWYGMLTCIFIGMTELRMSKFFLGCIVNIGLEWPFPFCLFLIFFSQTKSEAAGARQYSQVMGRSDDELWFSFIDFWFQNESFLSSFRYLMLSVHIVTGDVTDVMTWIPNFQRGCHGVRYVTRRITFFACLHCG